MSMYHMHAVPTEDRRGSHMLWDRSCSQLKAIMWMLRMKLGSPGRTASALNCWAISPCFVTGSFAGLELTKEG
ncbi:rCG39301 [Rattus norvegicus]|uniref:RCG39301 n=1 Tax=Rattus norvegicus TaxID=10116 RepID=A6IA26_RAT|nr:rCG39301 [Rattus norvegicus]